MNYEEAMAGAVDAARELEQWHTPAGIQAGSLKVLAYVELAKLYREVLK